MAYTDDWENLMNGVFGAGGKPRFGGTAQPESKTPKAKAPAVPDLNAALLENQKQLDALLKKQNAQLKTQDTAVQSALEDSRQMLRDMEADGLLAKGTADVTVEHLGSFEGLAAEVKKTVLGQDAFVDSVVRAMRRPFVLGTERPAARNVILLCGGAGTGRHFALAETARIMAARGLLQSDKTAVVDLALYPNSGAEKLFLQDLYAALHAPGEIVIFEHYESCHAAFLKTLADLAVKGSAPLSSRYLVNKEGILVDAGTALAPGAVSSITPCGKYLIFFSRKGRDALADKFGAPFVAAVGDVCTTSAFAREDLAALLDSNSPEQHSEPDNELKLFQNALDFADLRVRDCMVPRVDVEAVDIDDTSIEQLTARFVDSKYSRIFVWRKSIDNIVGYVNSKSLFTRPRQIADVMMEVNFVPETMPLQLMLENFIKHRSNIAVVIDEFGGTAGVISLEDVLEQIFGEIEDEHDIPDLTEKQVGPDEYVLSCRLEVKYLNEKYNLGIEESKEYDTLAGFIIFNYEGIPTAGETVFIGGLQLRILRTTRSRIELARVKKL